MRLIDADYAQGQLTIAEVESGKNFQTDCNHVRDFLNAHPTIDAVPVVRCKDCEHAKQHPIFPFSRRCKIEDYRLPHRADRFCSYGERKGDNAT